MYVTPFVASHRQEIHDFFSRLPASAVTSPISPAGAGRQDKFDNKARKDQAEQIDKTDQIYNKIYSCAFHGIFHLYNRPYLNCLCPRPSWQYQTVYHVYRKCQKMFVLNYAGEKTIVEKLMNKKYDKQGNGIFEWVYISVNLIESADILKKESYHWSSKSGGVPDFRAYRIYDVVTLLYAKRSPS